MASRPIRCLLVVEDDRAVRDLIVAFLRKGGYEDVITAGNAEEATHHIFKDSGLIIQAAIVDLVLPNASGLALIRKIRNAKSSRRRGIPVIVLTSRTDTETYRAAVRRGIHHYLMKPVSPDMLLEAVSKVLGARRLGPAPPMPPKAAKGS
ncbi:MAG: response regulator [Rhodospirillaceae bacterium]